MSYFTRQVQSPPMIGLIPVEINNGHTYQVFQTTNNQNSQQQHISAQLQQQNSVQQTIQDGFAKCHENCRKQLKKAEHDQNWPFSPKTT